MRLSRADLIPLLVITGGGAVGVVSTSALVLMTASVQVSVPAPSMSEGVHRVSVPAPSMSEGVDRVYVPVRPVFEPDRPVWSPDGTRVAYRVPSGRERFRFEAVSEPGSPGAAPAWPVPAPVRLVWSRDGGKIVLECRDRPRLARGDEWILESLRDSGLSLEQVRSSLQQVGYDPGIADRYFDLLEAERLQYQGGQHAPEMCLGSDVPIQVRISESRQRR